MTGNVPMAPNTSPEDMPVTQGPQGPIPSHLWDRLEVEERRTVEGVVQQVRFPGETQGESSSSRVDNWLDREGNAAMGVQQGSGEWTHATERQSDPQPGSPPGPQLEQPAEGESRPRSEQRASTTTGNHGEGNDKDEEMTVRGEDDMTEEEKELRQDSAYRSQNTSPVDIKGKGRKWSA